MPHHAQRRLDRPARLGFATGVLLAVSGAVVAAQDGPASSPQTTDLVSAAAPASAAAPVSAAPGSGERAASAQRGGRESAAALARARVAADAARAARAAQRDPRGAARPMLAEFGWGSGQFRCLDALWSKESNWRHSARNPSSGAFGIPQALPGAKMTSAGPDWRTNPITQIRWGLGYIKDVYGSPCAAWAHSRAVNWY